jgi:hypothetical protein
MAAQAISSILSRYRYPNVRASHMRSPQVTTSHLKPQKVASSILNAAQAISSYHTQAQITKAGDLRCDRVHTRVQVWPPLESFWDFVGKLGRTCQGCMQVFRN